MNSPNAMVVDERFSDCCAHEVVHTETRKQLETDLCSPYSVTKFNVNRNSFVNPAKTALFHILEIHCKKSLRHTHRINDSDSESYELEAGGHQKSNHPLFMFAAFSVDSAHAVKVAQIDCPFRYLLLCRKIANH